LFLNLGKGKKVFEFLDFRLTILRAKKKSFALRVGLFKKSLSLDLVY